jgi:hypothetical protein
MRIPIITLSIFIISFNTKAQIDTLQKYNLSAGVGYFSDIVQYLHPGFNEPEFVKVNPKVVGKIYNGTNVWFRLGYKLKTGYIISGYYSMAAISYNMNDPLGLYWDDYLTDTYKLANLMFSVEFGKKKNHFSPGLGVLYRKYCHHDIDYEITPVYDAENNLIDVQLGLPYPSNLKMNDLGFIFEIDYKRMLNKKIFIGLSCSTNLIFDIGFETISISPIIGCAF